MTAKVFRALRLPPETDAAIKRLAEKNNVSDSEIMRGLLLAGLNMRDPDTYAVSVAGYREDIEDLGKHMIIEFPIMARVAEVHDEAEAPLQVGLLALLELAGMMADDDTIRAKWDPRRTKSPSIRFHRWRMELPPRSTEKDKESAE